MTVAVVTAWHNHPELVDGYMAALAAGPSPDERVVVDNGSDPRLEFSQVRCGTNRGFCAANNIGLRVSTADVVVFLNNDIRATRDGWLDDLLASVEPGVLAGAMLRNDVHAHVDGVAMPYLDGWCLAGMRQDLLDLGGFDETLQEPAYYSDNILCLRARAAGMTLREADGLGLVHICGATSSRDVAGRAAATEVNRRRYVEEARVLLTPA